MEAESGSSLVESNPQSMLILDKVSTSFNDIHDTSVLIPCCRDIIEAKLLINSVVTFVEYYVCNLIMFYFLF